MGNIDSRIVGLLASLACMTAAALPPTVQAGDGTIVIQRTVQPRVATRPTMVPDPNPITVNPNISAQINRQVGNAELDDAEFARVTSGSSLSQRILPGGNLVGMDNGANQTLQSGSLGGGGGSGAGISNSVNRTVQQGLSPLRMLTGDR
ncbi:MULTISPECIES: hypothetical protein [Pseudomonas]|jgi:hypothetical protein|uniref:hypothetical protein n=1 Tax=Pseudomonas TaxID=286 RepID=UPI000730C3F7|nr:MULTISPECIES: hypothetical protein [Pseudomonas]KSW22048.1 hypothetical protein AOX63_01010 [Pseudomonas sp. ADP]AMO76672.1 hypothetical protein PcP3B5_32530 [Pseudomonas citronellolis]OBP10506.1 hypothetical protein BAE52_15065 [Pseudomonas sp. EGD-AKN5]QOF84831.1 hypothetical protein IG194_30700 [Pseudomonas sp. ADPe]WBG61960.1 hypothetical protein ELR50_03280 [Pseudomonas citronellolis]